MKSLTLFRAFFIFVSLLITNSVSSNTLYRDLTNSTEIQNFSALSVDGIYPTSGHAGTIITITGASFTPTSIVLLGALTIPSANIQFVSSTELNVTLPCGLNSGYFTVDGNASSILFTYIEPTVSTILPNLSYCVGTTVPQIALLGTPAVPTTPTTLEFSWKNTNTAIGLIVNGEGNLPTFTARNSTNEPIGATIIITPSINGCNGPSKSYTITINPRPIADAISDISVCAGTTISPIFLTASTPLNGTGTSFVWSGANNSAIGLSTTSGITSPIPSFTAVNETNALLSSVFTVTPTFEGCIGIASNFTIQVSPSVSSAPTIGTITQPTCTTTSGSVILSGLPIGNWTITKLPGGQTYSNTGNTYTITNLAAGTYSFSVSNGTCSSLSSENIDIDTLLIQSAPIVDLIVQPTCTTPNGSVTLSGLPTETWTLIRIQDGLQFTNSGSSTTISDLASGTYNYTVKNVLSDCVSVASSSIEIYPQPFTPSAPTLVSPQFFITGAKVSDLQVPSGSVKWYLAPSGGNALNTLTTLATGTYYASDTIGSCESLTRSEVLVTIYPPTEGGIVNAVNASSVCSGDSANLILTGYVGSILRWESSPVSNFTSNVTLINNTSANYIANLTSSLYFRAVVQSPGYSYINSEPALITVNQPSNAGTLSPLTSAICKNVLGGIITLSGNIGTVVKWQKSTNGGSSWTDIVSTATVYSVPALSVTTAFRAVVKNGVCAELANTIPVTITVNPDPTSAITTGPSVICETQSNVFLEATISNDYGAIVWEVVPANAGYLAIISDKRVQFTPTPAGILLGSVNIQHALFNQCGVVQTPVNFPITIQKQAIANAGKNVTTCGTNAVTMDASSTQNATSFNWSIVTNGITGILDSSNPYKPSFTPSTSDINHVGPITIKLEANSGTDCISSISNVSVLITKPPVVDAGSATATICEGTAYPISTPASSASNVVLGSLNWVTGGDGRFSNLNDLNTVYTPGTEDIKAGFAVLTLSGTGNSPCFTPATDTVILTIVKKPTVDLGVDKIVCQGPVNIYSNIQNAGTIQWTINGGSGSFVDSTVSSPIYNPDPVFDKDKLITFSVKVTPKNACGLDVTGSVIYKINATPVVIVGGNSTICETQPTFNVTSTTNYTDSVIWTSTGTGSFDNPNSNAATYTFSPGDITAGSVIFTIRGDKYNCTSVTDAMTVTIRKNPIANAGADKTICQGDTIYFSGSAPNAVSQSWTQGLASGVLNQSTTLTPNYVSTSTESGTFTFTLTAQPDSPTCTIPSISTTKVTVIAKPTVVFSTTTLAQRTICEGLNYVVNSANATNSSSLVWSTNGDGKFISGANTLTPTYEPGTLDKSMGSVTLTLKALKEAPCSADAEDSIVLTITKKPIITSSLKTSIDVCTGVGVPVPLTNVDLDIHASNFDELNWNSSSTFNLGFLDPSPTNTDNFNSYTPTEDDIANGSVNLTLLAIRNSGCNTFADKIITLNFIKIPVADAGPDDTICEDGTYSSTTAKANNQTSVIWTSNGSAGTIANQTQLTGMIYTPSQADKDRGSVTLTLTAYGDSCQPKVTDDIKISFKKLPQITLPTDTSICESSTSFAINGASVIDGGTVTWSSVPTGGSFSASNVLNTTYYPSAADKTRGFVILTLTSEATAECSTTQSKTFKLSFVKLPTVYAGSDINSCDLQFKVLNATATNYSAIQWTSIGTGSLDMSSIDKLEAIYNPISGQTGSVTLTLEVTPLAACLSTGTISDFMVATFIDKPTITVIPQDDICADSPNTKIFGTTITDALSYEWTSTAGTTIINKNDREPSIIASATDILNGYIDLTITAKPNVPCVDTVSKIVRVEIKPLGTITVTNDLTLCMIDANNDGLLDSKNLSATFTDRNLADPSSILWEIVSGKGSLDNANSDTPTFRPGTDTDEVKIRVSVKNVTPCTGVVFKEFTLKAVQKPVVTLSKSTDSYCSSALFYRLEGNSVLDPSNRVEWTRITPSGTGNFGNNAIPNTTYTFSDADRTNGSVTLRLTAYADPLCSTLSTYKEITILIDKAPTATITSPLIICAGEPYTATALNPDGNTLAWTEINGNHGIFVNGTLDTATFNQSLNNSSDFEIQLTSNTTAICAAKVVTQMITVQPKPTIDVGDPDQDNCSSQPFVISGVTGTEYDSVLWTIDGTNSSLGFSDKNALNPTFTPTPGQIEAGSVVLKIIAKAKSPCGTIFDVWDTITLHFTPAQTVSFTAPSSICEGNTISLVGSAPNSSSVAWSTSSTTATTGFDYPTVLNAVYTPSVLDKSLGKVTLTLTGITNSNCPIAIQSREVLIKKKPIAYAGAPVSICQGTVNYTVNDASASNYDASVPTNIYWSLTGPAIIQSGTENSITPIIVPTVGASGSIVLTLNVTSFSECAKITTATKTITIVPNSVITVPSAKTICEGQTLTLTTSEISATNSGSVLWTASQGTFSPTNALATIYTPAAGQTGLVNLILTATAIDGVCTSVSSPIALNIIAKPKINAGIDLLACQESSSVLLNGATVSNYNSNYTVSWSSSGNGTWDYTNSNGGINPVYIFGSNDTSSVTLTMSVLPNSNCPQVAVTDAMTITINQNPAIITTSNVISMCGETFTLPDLVTVSNSNNLLWTNITVASGTPGTLTNTTTETPTFTPSDNEIANGFVLLQLTATPISGCNLPTTTTIQVNLQPKAKINLVPNVATNIKACQGEVITINNIASVEDYSTFMWTENGTGSIVPSTLNTLQPEYVSGPNETGVVSFTLQATDLGPCTGLVSQIVTLTIAPQPTVNAGPDVTICQNTPLALNTATTANSNSIIWLSSENSNGTSSPGYTGGSFSNINIINPTYTPSQDDINLGYVYLTVRAANTSCNSLVTDVIKVTITPQITVAAGSNTTICEGSAFTLAEASQTNAVGYTWTSSQNSNKTSIPTYISGSFSSNSILNTVYTPSLDDINLGHVYLTITATGGTNCPIATSQMKLTIVKKPTVSTTDVQMCMNTPQISLSGFATNYATINWIIYSGSGSISPNPANELNPTFISGISGLSTVQTTVVRLYVTPYPGCPQATAEYDDLVISIQPLPTVEAGVNGSVCYVSGQPIAPFEINGTSVTNASSQNWTSSGVGIFTVGTPVLYQSLSNSCTSDVLTLTATGIGACSTSRVTDSVTLSVNCSIPSLGTISSNAPTTICQGATATYSIPANSNIQNYTWSVPSGATIQSGQGTNAIQVLYTSIASSGNVAVTGANGCGSVISTLAITINTLPTVTSVTGQQTVCAGANNIVYTASTIPNATSYIWTLPNGSTITTATNTISISFGLNDVSGNLSVSGSNSCGLGSVSSDFPITINPQPSLSSSLTPIAICSNNQFNYVPTSATAGATFGWTRATQSGISNPAASGSNSINEILINTTPNAFSVSYQITTTSIQGCTNTQTVVVIVNPAPSLTSIAPPAAICSGSVFNYTPVSASVGTISWVRNAVSGIVELASNGPGTINEVLTNSTTLPITVTYLLTIPDTANGCSSTTATPIDLVVNPSPQVAVNSINLCIGTSQLITATPNIPGTYSYSWTVPLGVTNPGSVGSFSVNTAGTYSVVITNTTTLCSGASASGIVTIVPLPIVTLNSATICAGGTATLTATPTVLGNYTYAWTVPSGAINPGNVNSITSGIAGTYSVVITDTATTCSSASAFGTIIINALPVVSVNNPSICAGANATLTATPSTVGIYSYAWTVPLGAINPGDTASFSATLAGNYSVIITNTVTTCSSSSASGTVTVNPIPTVSVNNASVCSGLSTTITATPGLPGTYFYAWTVPAGANNPGNTASFSASVGGTYSVVIINTTTLCSSTSTSGIVTIVPLPIVTLNSATICAGGTATLTATPTVLGNYTYAWTVPSGAINPGNVNSITSGIAGTYSVVITDTATTCSSASAFGTIIINALPVVSVNNPSICAGANATLTAIPSTVGTYSYAWTVPLGAINPGDTASFSTTLAGNYSVIITNTTTTCFSASASGTVTVNPIPTVSVNSTSICSGTSTIIAATPSLPGAYYYAWIVPGGVINPGDTASFSATIAGTYSVVITNLATNCSSLLASGTLTVVPLPIVVVTNPAPICAPNTVDITTTTTGFSAGLTFSYWNNSSATIAITNPTTISVSGTYYIKGTNASGCATIHPVVVEISPSPIATISGQNNFVVCQNGTEPTVTFTGSNGTAPYTFTYEVIKNSSTRPPQTVTTLGANTSSTISFSTASEGNYIINLLSVQDSSAALCNSSNITLPNTAFVTVQQVGTIIPINQAVVSQTICQNTPITPIIFTIGGAATNAFATNLPNGLSGSYASGIFTISGTPLATGVFNYVVNTSGSTNGCNSAYTGTITVNSNDSISILPTAMVNQTVCNNVAIQPIVYNLGGGATGGTVTFSPSQPLGITWSIVSNVITISGASNTIGSFNYTVQSFGICGQSTATGNITINPSTTIALVSGNPNTTVCLGSSFASPIQYSITPASATMVVTGLPTGVIFDPTTGIITGTPTQSGTFSYSISSTTNCGNTLTGTITVNPLQSIGYLSGNTNQVACQNTPIDPINFLVSSGVNTVTITPTLPAGINYNIAPNGILTVSGTPTSPTSLAQNYTITTQGTCWPQATYSITFDIRPEATITLTAGSGSINQSVCQSSAIDPITFTIGGGATGIAITPTLPPGLSLTLVGGVYTIQGNPLNNGSNNFNITTTGCPKTVAVTITNVNASVGITLTSAVGTDKQTLCQTITNTQINPIIYNVVGATNVVVNGLPPGVTALFSVPSGQLIISGAPFLAGIFNYTITTEPCSIVKTGVIKVSTPISITNEIVTDVACADNLGSIAVTIVGGSPTSTGQYAVSWTGPNGFRQNQPNITGLQGGAYVLNVTDSFGCSIPPKTYNVLPAVPIGISVSTTNVSCNETLGTANFNFTGGSGIYTFKLQLFDPNQPSPSLVTIIPPFNNYYNITNLVAGRYYLTVTDSRNCSPERFLFNIYDYGSLSIDSIIMDDNLCQDTPGKVRIKVKSLDTNLSFYYNSVLVPATNLGNSLYELSINTPTKPSGIIKVINSQNCSVTTTVTTPIAKLNFTFTSSDFEAFRYYSVNRSVQFINSVDINNIPAEYAYIVWDFGDNTPFKVFRNPEDKVVNADGENFETVFHTYTTNGIYQVTLSVYNHFGCSRQVTETIIIGSGATIMLPTIFTPNGDGINDMFRPSIVGLKDVSMYVYDGWGNVVYEVSSKVSLLSTDYWGWNGIEKGQTEPMNNEYRYYIIATTINDKIIEKEGKFLLVK